jgi:hypothetical protein
LTVPLIAAIIRLVGRIEADNAKQWRIR